MINWAAESNLTPAKTGPRLSVDSVRRQLALARTIEQVLRALADVDRETLCTVAEGYGLLPASAPALRERIAKAHVLLITSVVRGAAVLSTERLTVDHVHDWAADALREWLDGHYEYEPSLGGQFRIRLVDDTHDHDLVFGVDTPEGHGPRRFRVTLAVTEETTG